MAKLSKERYLVLSVDDSREDSLKIQLAFSEKQRSCLLGSFVSGENVASNISDPAGPARNKFPTPDMIQLDALMSRKGFEIVEWLQNQPFEDVVVIILPRPGQNESCVTSLQTNAAAVPLANIAGSSTSIDLANLLEQYFQRQH